MAPFMLIGAVGGLVGAIVNRGVVRVAKLRKTTFLKRYPVRSAPPIVISLLFQSMFLTF